MPSLKSSTPIASANAPPPGSSAMTCMAGPAYTPLVWLAICALAQPVSSAETASRISNFTLIQHPLLRHNVLWIREITGYHRPRRLTVRQWSLYSRPWRAAHAHSACDIQVRTGQHPDSPAGYPTAQDNPQNPRPVERVREAIYSRNYSGRKGPTEYGVRPDSDPAPTTHRTLTPSASGTSQESARPSTSPPPASSRCARTASPASRSDAPRR